MAEEQNGMAKLGEISTIRDILMGQQMSEYESRFAKMEEYVNQLENTLQQKIASLSGDSGNRFDALELKSNEQFTKMETTMNEHFNELERATNNRFAQLEKLLLDNVERLNEEIKTVSTQDKQRLGKMLTALGTQLMEE